MESGDPTVLGSRWDNSLYIAAGKDPFILIEKAVAAAAQLSGGAQQRQDKRQPDSLNWFGWCTWDAYYSKVSARGNRLQRAAPSSESRILPRCIILARMLVRLYRHPLYSASALLGLMQGNTPALCSDCCGALTLWSTALPFVCHEPECPEYSLLMPYDMACRSS